MQIYQFEYKCHNMHESVKLFYSYYTESIAAMMKLSPETLHWTNLRIFFSQIWLYKTKVPGLKYQYFPWTANEWSLPSRSIFACHLIFCLSVQQNSARMQHITKIETCIVCFSNQNTKQNHRICFMVANMAKILGESHTMYLNV